MTATGRRILLLTYGSRGDVEPFVALGLGLQNAGHAVRLVCPAPYAPLAEARGLACAPIEGNPDELAQAFADRAGLSWPKMIVSMMRHVLPLATRVFTAVQAAGQDVDLIVHSFLMTDAGHTLACMRGVPDVSAQFFPIFLPTADFAALTLPDLPLGPAYRRATHAFNTAIFRHGARMMYASLRRSHPELPALAPWLLREPVRPETALLYAYSPQVLPRPAEWPPYAHVTGYWQLPVPAGWQPPDGLARFLETGPAPVYFGPGSMSSAKLPALLGEVAAAARACGKRLVLGLPPESIETELRGDDLIAAGGVPHAWLFPRMGFILHHGGAGTTGAAAAAGVPNSAVPFSADQAFWARRVQRLGLGPAAPDAHHLTRTNIEAVLREGLGDPAYRQHAVTLGERIREEDGTAAAVGVIQDLLGR